MLVFFDNPTNWRERFLSEIIHVDADMVIQTFLPNFVMFVLFEYIGVKEKSGIVLITKKMGVMFTAQCFLGRYVHHYLL